MARIRTIKPEFPHSESMGRVSRDARLTFILLWTIADDSGRLRGSSRLLASLLYPYDNDAGGKIGKWLAELEAENCIIQYTVDQQQYIEIHKFNAHQKIDRPTPSRLPELARTREDSTSNREDSPPYLVPSTSISNGPVSVSGSGHTDSEGGESPARQRHKPPTVEQVASYCTERGNGIDAERFVDFYAARGWKLSRGTTMKDWQAAVRTWEKNQAPTSQPEDRVATAADLANHPLYGGGA